MISFIFRSIVISSLVLFSTLATQAQIQVTHFQQHSVEKGETAKTIAAKYNIDFIDFILLNDFPADVKLPTGTIVLIREIKEDELDKQLSGTTTDEADTSKPKEEIQVSGLKPGKPVVNLAPEPVKTEPKVAKQNIVYGPNRTRYIISQNGYHIVEKNQTCYRIALIYEINLDYLMELNNLSSYTIEIGQKLKVRK